METTEYKLLSQNDEGKEPEMDPVDNWRPYPGERRPELPLGSPPESVLVRTGGNALQAIDRRACEQKNLIKVIVPNGVEPGQTMLVICPDGTGRMVSILVPPQSSAGHVLLVRVPPLPPPATPIVCTGIPVEPLDNVSAGPIVPSHDIQPATIEEDLVLLEEAQGIPIPQRPVTPNEEPASTAAHHVTSSDNSNGGEKSACGSDFEMINRRNNKDRSVVSDGDDEDFEMVPNKHQID